MGKVLKGLVFDNQVSLTIIDSTDIVNKAIGFHKLTPLTAAALGRSLTACVFMCSTMKDADDRLSVTIDGGGVGGKIVVCGDSSLKVRGSIENPSATLPPNNKGKLDVAGCVGSQGKITVVRANGNHTPYVGSCNIVSGELAEDFAAYYAYSEQQPTAMALGVRVNKEGLCLGAGGVIFQPLPDTQEENIVKIEKILPDLNDVSYLIETLGAKGIKDKYFAGYDLEESFAEYKCICSDEYIDKIVLSLGKAECEEILKKEGKIEICCHFCDKKYTYSKEDIDKLFG